MSLVVARMADLGGVALAADTRGTSQHNGMNYEYAGLSKARVFGKNGVVGITGDVPLMMEFLQDAEEAKSLLFTPERSPRETVELLGEHFRGLYEKRFGPKGWDIPSDFPTTLTFAGDSEYRGERQTFIYEMSVGGFFGGHPQPKFGASGQSIHGGCYYLHRLQHLKLSLKDAAFLTYFCICEVAALDHAVGLPVEVFTVKDGLATPISEEWLKEFGEQHQRAYEQIQGWFQSLGNI